MTLANYIFFQKIDMLKLKIVPTCFSHKSSKQKNTSSKYRKFSIKDKKNFWLSCFYEKFIKHGFEKSVINVVMLLRKYNYIDTTKFSYLHKYQPDLYEIFRVTFKIEKSLLKKLFADLILFFFL